MFKRKFDIRQLGMLFTLLMVVCLSAFALTRTDEWTLNPSDFRYDMSLYFTIEPGAYNDTDNYEIGAFVGDECRGLAQKLDLPDGSACLYMRVRSNSAEGDEVHFSVRDRATGMVNDLSLKDDKPLIFNADEMVGLPSDPVVMLYCFNVAVQWSEHGTVTFENGEYPYGTVIELTAEPEEGYHFDSWSDGNLDNPRTITVESDLNLSANFSVTSYTVTFMLGEELFELRTLPYGDAIVAPEVPEREGYTFGGWGDLPETMPANELVVKGEYKPNVYKLYLMLDGEVYMEYDTPYGTPLNRDDFQNSTPPEREGYTFAGWGDVPEVMPARDLELTGSYTVNTYKITLLLNGEIFQVLSIPYGEKIDLPTPPENEGQSFAGWGDVPETMPAQDLLLSGTYAYNGYKVTFIVDNEIFEVRPFQYGDKIEYPELPEREGYSFSGWSETPETMPARDLVLSGEYIANLYKMTLYVDDELYKEYYITYGTELKIDEPEPREGYSFSGWGEVLKTMPAYDVELRGQFLPNIYKLTLILDGEVYEVLSFQYGAEVTVIDAPEKEGYTFSGWSEVPATMPASDLEITGSYVANIYKLTFYLDDEVYKTEELAYGEVIVLPEPEVEEGKEFKGWEGEIPERMPAHDLAIYGHTGDGVGVITVGADKVEAEGVYDIQGRHLNDTERLDQGLYIINGKKIYIK